MASLTNLLLAIIGIAFILQLILPVFTDVFIFDPGLALSQPWRFVSSIFLHGGFTHIFFNAYALFVFGSILESRISKKDYLLLFFGAGILGSVLYFATYVFGVIPDIPALGASGAIYGILGALAILLPDMQIFVFFFPMKLRYAAVLWFVLELVGAFNIASGIASAAHLGGLVFGVAYGWYINRSPPEFGNAHYEWQQTY